MTEAKTWSYLYFSNTGHENKNYFYFITSVHYVSDTVVELHLEMDVMQSYLFDYNLLPCFVEREHASIDTIGLHTVDEGLELGEYRTVNEVQLLNTSELCVLVLSTFDPILTTEENTETVLSARFDNMFYGLGVYAVAPADYQAWGQKLKLLDEYGKSDGIISHFKAGIFRRK